MSIFISFLPSTVKDEKIWLWKVRKLYFGTEVVEFFIRWQRKSRGREQGGCFARQPSHKLKFNSMRPLSHHYTSCYCHTTHNISFFYAQIMELYIYYETTYKTIHYMYCLLHHLKMTWQFMRLPIRLDQCSCPKDVWLDEWNEVSRAISSGDFIIISFSFNATTLSKFANVAY